MKRSGELDEIDFAIIRQLVRSPRIPNRELAQVVGVSAPTLYSRLRDLNDEKVCEVRAQIDFAFLGYRRLAMIDIHPQVRPVGAIAEDLAEIPECTGLMHFNDDPRLVAAFVARDDDHLNAIYASKVAPIAGISRTSVNVVTRLIKYGVDFGEIGVDRHDPLPLLAGEIGLDAVDAAIMETLRTNARLSNREIGRAIGASESNIRKRLARLLAANAIKFSLVCAPAKMGLRVWGQGCIAVRPAVRDQVVEHLLTHHNIHTMYEITGEWGVQFMGVFPSANEFHALIRGVTDLAGHNIDVSARMMLRSQKHNCDYVRIMSDTQQHPVFDAEVQTMTIA